MSHDENEQQHIKSGANESKNEACFGFAECSWKNRGGVTPEAEAA